MSRLVKHALGACLTLAAPLHGVATRTAGAQERLIGSRTVGAAASFETIAFGGRGLLQSAFAGLDTTRVQNVSQLTMPVTASAPLGNDWRVDVTTLFATGRVTFADAQSGTTRGISLTGISDVRARATGRLFAESVLMTVGVNAPTGRMSLSGDQFSALRVLASPALGLGSSPVGAGLSGTLGLVFAQQVGQWALAYGTSYEMRGQYQPVAALTAGSPSTDFLPGGVFRASVTADRLIGPHRFNVSLASDIFADDRLRGGALVDTAGAPSESRVRLGPVLSTDVQLQVATSRLRDLLLFTSYRWRAPYARDGATVERSSGQYLEGGVRMVLPWKPGRDVVVSTDARWHSGLGVDQGLPTAGVTSGSATVALQLARGLLSFQPFVRAQGGELRQRAAIIPSANTRFVGVGGGLVIVNRF